MTVVTGNTHYATNSSGCPSKCFHVTPFQVVSFGVCNLSMLLETYTSFLRNHVSSYRCVAKGYSFIIYIWVVEVSFKTPYSWCVMSFKYLPSLHPYLQVVVNKVPFSINDGNVSYGGYFRRNKSPCVEDVSVYFIPVIQVSSFLTTVYAIAIYRTSSSQFRIYTFCGLTVFIGHRQIFGVSFGGCFVTFKSVVLCICLSKEYHEGVGEIKDLLVIFSVVKVMSIVFTSCK